MFSETACETTAARRLAAEDVQPGDFVAITNVEYELPSFLWCADTATLPPHEPVRVQLRSPRASQPLKVKAVCLPFVLVKAPSGKYRTLDVRGCQLVKLNATYGQVAWKALKPKRKKRRKKEEERQPAKSSEV